MAHLGYTTLSDKRPHWESEADMATKDLQLYVKNNCPFCAKVEGFMSKNGIDLPLHNIDESEDDRSFLVERGGKRQVPCLFVDGTALYESDDIVDFLAKEFHATEQADGSASTGGACRLDGTGCSF
ncbi:glutaredoxin [Olsenella profusa F0195]|uniref:Glutaredoxin n=2 Tax=Olsenella profusa TaxID=138595 RepID=U2TKC5_9ACTN|nr:glutaredoxin [Olsenella profusa F0195]